MGRSTNGHLTSLITHAAHVPDFPFKFYRVCATSTSLTLTATDNCGRGFIGRYHSRDRIDIRPCWGSSLCPLRQV